MVFSFIAFPYMLLNGIIKMSTVTSFTIDISLGKLDLIGIISLVLKTKSLLYIFLSMSDHSYPYCLSFFSF